MQPTLLIPVSSSNAERGASMVELSLILSVVAFVCLGAVTVMGQSIDNDLQRISKNLETAETDGPNVNSAGSAAGSRAKHTAKARPQYISKNRIKPVPAR